MTFEKINFESNPKIVTVTHTIKNISDDTGVDLDIKILQDFPVDAIINIEVSTETNPGTFDSLINGGDMAVCDLLRNATEQPLFKLVVGGLKKFTNLPLVCPVAQVFSKVFKIILIYLVLKWF